MLERNIYIKYLVFLNIVDQCIYMNIYFFFLFYTNIYIYIYIGVDVFFGTNLYIYIYITKAWTANDRLSII